MSCKFGIRSTQRVVQLRDYLEYTARTAAREHVVTSDWSSLGFGCARTHPLRVRRGERSVNHGSANIAPVGHCGVSACVTFVSRARRELLGRPTLGPVVQTPSHQLVPDIVVPSAVPQADTSPRVAWNCQLVELAEVKA